MKKKPERAKRIRQKPLKSRCKDAIAAWLKDNKKGSLLAMRHLHPRAYVLGHAAPGCLIVAKCWVESEPHMKDWDRENPIDLIYIFDQTLRAGDWCTSAYIIIGAGQENIAIKLVE